MEREEELHPHFLITAQAHRLRLSLEPSLNLNNSLRLWQPSCLRGQRSLTAIIWHHYRSHLTQLIEMGLHPHRLRLELNRQALHLSQTQQQHQLVLLDRLPRTFLTCHCWHVCHHQLILLTKTLLATLYMLVTFHLMLLRLSSGHYSPLRRVSEDCPSERRISLLALALAHLLTTTVLCVSLSLKTWLMPPLHWLNCTGELCLDQTAAMAKAVSDCLSQRIPWESEVLEIQEGHLPSRVPTTVPTTMLVTLATKIFIKKDTNGIASLIL